MPGSLPRPPRGWAPPTTGWGSSRAWEVGIVLGPGRAPSGMTAGPEIRASLPVSDGNESPPEQSRWRALPCGGRWSCSQFAHKLVQAIYEAGPTRGGGRAASQGPAPKRSLKRGNVLVLTANTTSQPTLSHVERRIGRRGKGARGPPPRTPAQEAPCPSQTCRPRRWEGWGAFPQWASRTGRRPGWREGSQAPELHGVEFLPPAGSLKPAQPHVGCGS